MLINWFTVGAQIINFLVLLALLKWLLFDRVTRAMDERQQTIADRLEEARRKQEEAEQREQELQDKHREIDQQREELLVEARQRADRRREELVDQARQEVEQSRRKWQDDLASHQDRFLDDITRRAGELLRDSVRRALNDLADAQLNRQVVRRFADELERLDDETQERLHAAFDEAEGNVVLVTAGEMSDELREQLAEAVRKCGGDDSQVDPSFEQAAELIAGVELRAGGHAVGWNLRQYLDRFDENLREHLARQQ